MAFKKKTWKNRLVEFAGRRTLKRVSGSADSTLVVDVSRNEGTVSQEGDAFSAANMNDLEQRIADGFSEQPEWIRDSTGKITGYKTSAGADTVIPFSKEVIDLGTSTSTIDVSSYDGYKDFTKNNFFTVFTQPISQTSLVKVPNTINGSTPGIYTRLHFSYNDSAYNASTGIYTVPRVVVTPFATSGAAYFEGYGTAYGIPVRTYLVR